MPNQDFQPVWDKLEPRGVSNLWTRSPSDAGQTLRGGLPGLDRRPFRRPSRHACEGACQAEAGVKLRICTPGANRSLEVAGNRLGPGLLAQLPAVLREPAAVT